MATFSGCRLKVSRILPLQLRRAASAPALARLPQLLYCFASTMGPVRLQRFHMVLMIVCTISCQCDSSILQSWSLSKQIVPIGEVRVYRLAFAR